jgi:hypothetical protein
MSQPTQSDRRYLRHWVRSYQQRLEREFPPPADNQEFAILLRCADERADSSGPAPPRDKK